MEPNATTPPQPSAGTAQKYIRTYAGDIATVQKGGTPDLVPLVDDKKPSVAPAEKTPSPTLKEIPIPPPIPAASLPKLPTPPVPVPETPVIRVPMPVATVEDDIKKRNEVLARLRAQTAAASAKPLSPEVPVSIHTYSGDFSEHIKEEHASTTTVLAAEQDAAPLEVAEPQEFTWSKLVFIVAGVLLLVLGGGGIYYAYVRYAQTLPVMPIAANVSAPIFVDEQEQVAGEGPALMQTIAQFVTRALPAGSVRLLYRTNATTTEQSIFASISAAAPDILLRNISGADSMAGIVSAGNAQSPFFILSVSSYNETFAGMLSWEKTLPNDFGTLYPPYPTLAVSTSTATTTAPLASTTVKTVTKKVATTTPPVPVFVPAFHDEVVANHDVRVYRDAFGQSILLYGYWNQTTLVIARDSEAMTLILGRLANARTQP